MDFMKVNLISLNKDRFNVTNGGISNVMKRVLL